MITKKQFQAVDLGAMIEASTIFDGLTKEPIVFICEDVNTVAGIPQTATFGMYYFGIELGKVFGDASKSGKIEWEVQS